jgi:hypothetical protein
MSSTSSNKSLNTSSDKKPFWTEGRKKVAAGVGATVVIISILVGIMYGIVMAMNASASTGPGAVSGTSAGTSPNTDITSVQFYKNCNYNQNVNHEQNYYDKTKGPKQMNINIKSFRIRNCKITLYKGRDCTGEEKTFETNLTNNGYLHEPCFNSFIVQSIKIEPLSKT